MNAVTIIHVGVYDLRERKLRVFFLSEHSAVDSPLEWWVSEDGQHHALYHQDAYYDSELRVRHRQGMMLCPQDKKQRLHLIGYIDRQVDLPPRTFVELYRTEFVLKSATIDAK